MVFDLGLLTKNQQETTALFLEDQGHKTGKNGIVAQYIFQENKKIKIESDGRELKIYGEREVHFYRGLHLFLQKAEKRPGQAFSYEEDSDFAETGILLDCSRNGAMSLDMIKRFIRLCAASGVGQIYLYIEDVYEIPEEPYFGAYRGRYTCRELRELDEYGKKAGVELIPAIQTLAHLHTYLRWPKTAGIRDTEDILLVGEKETNELVRLMLKNISKAFSTRKIHVGMDEAGFLGLGQYLRNNGYRERYGIMMEHLTTVCGLCREEGLEPMMWSDMFFRLKSPTGDYYDLEADTEFNLPLPVPEDMTLVYWDYYHHDKKEYDKNILLHKKLTDKLCFAGGGWTWNGLAPNYGKARGTLERGLASCKEQGIQKVFCTIWFDNGTETPVKTAVYSLIYFAQLCYGDKTGEGDMDSWLLQLTGYSEKAYQLLDAFDRPEGTCPENCEADNPSKYLLYQDMLGGIFDGQIQDLKLERYYMELEEKLKNLPKNEGFMKPVFDYYTILAGALKDKAMLGIKLRGAYKEDRREELAVLLEQAKKAKDRVWELKEARKEIWFSECRPFGFEILDIRLGGVVIRLDSGINRVKNYLEGKLLRLEELEEEPVVYQKDIKNREHKLCRENLWQNMIGAGNISGV